MSMDEDSSPSRVRSQSESAKSINPSDRDSEKAEKADKSNGAGADERLPEDAEIDEEELFGEAAEDSS